MTEEVKQIEQEVLELSQKLKEDLDNFRAIAKDYEEKLQDVKTSLRLKSDKLQGIKNKQNSKPQERRV